MEVEMYVFYLKSNRVAEAIGDNLMMDSEKVVVFKEQKIRASFMLDGIEGFVTKKVTEDDTRKE